MAEFTESLTIRILGDSSQFDRELQKVTTTLTRFHSEMSEMSHFQDYFSRLGQQVNRFKRPLENVSRVLVQITSQVTALSRYPVVLNVAPAMANLTMLSQMIDLLFAKLTRLAAFSAAVSTSGSASAGESGSVAQFARGGVVHGPGGIDRVPALLTAGEFVLRKPVVQQLGTAFLQSLNANGPTALRNHSSNQVNSQQTDIHHYGGFTVNVTQPVPVSSILKTLKQQSTHIRNRRG